MAPLNKKRQLSILSAASIAGTIAAAASALAAPQILAVAATDLKLPVTCDAGICAVELTTICLQEHRASPNVGAGYYVHGETFFDLKGRNAVGQEISLAHLSLEITATRGHNAVRLAFGESHLTKYGPLEVSISVPENLSLVPLPVANDLKPQTEADILLATGPLREAATRLVDLDDNKRDAAELISQAINRLPWRGRASDEERAAVRASYHNISDGSGFTRSAKDSANTIVRDCYERTLAGSLSFRGCLGSWHDRMIGKLNTKYWKSLGAGS